MQTSHRSTRPKNAETKRRMKWQGKFLTLALVVLIGGSLLTPVSRPASAQDNTPRISDSVQQQMQALIDEKESRTPEQQKIDSHLVLELRARRDPAIARIVPSAGTGRRRVAVAGGPVLVDIRAKVTPPLLDRIRELGGEVVSSFEQYDAIRASLPLEQLEMLAREADVKFIRPAEEGWSNRASSSERGPIHVGSNPHPFLQRGWPATRAERAARLREQISKALAPAVLTKNALGHRRALSAITGTIDSEGDVAHRADQVHALGITGAGVRIGVMSDGVDALAAEQAAGELPAVVTVVPGQAGSGNEGTAMLEIVADLAPGATLFFATAGGGPANMASNVTTLGGAPYNCDIIVDDFTYSTEAVFQDDVISVAVNGLPAGVLFFSSAGNSGNFNDGTSGVWEGDFANGGTLALVPGGNVHDFGGGVVGNTVTGAASSGRRITLKWSDPRGASSNDYDLFILNAAMTAIIDSSTNTQSGSQDPFEVSNMAEVVGQRVVILQKTGAATRALHLNTNRGRLAIATSGQVFGHNAAGAANAFSVSAVNAATAGGGPFIGGVTNPVETFTSDGLRRIFYTPAGAPITPGNVLFGTNGGTLLNKPDITAADGVMTGAPGFNPFFGTSAAAPHAAALAALVKGFKPALTAAQIRTALTSSALDIEAAGYDRDAGFGIVMALQAISAVSSADLEITKTAPVTVIAPATFTYTINVKNNGPDPAAFITVSDPVPASGTIVSTTMSAGWTKIQLANTVSFLKDTMASGETATFTIMVSVGSCTPDGTVLNNQATISSTTSDPNTNNNSSTATTTVNRRADLVLTKSGAPATVIAGNGQITYTLTSTNNGPSCALDLKIADTIPANTRFVSAVGSVGASLVTPIVGGSGTVTATWNGETSPGISRTLTIVVRVCAEVACNTIITNTGTTSSANVDPDLSNNSATSNPTTVQAQADLAVSKVGMPNPVKTGQNVTYTLTVSNAGPSNSVNTVLTDVLPKGFTPVLPLPAGCTASPVDPNTSQVTVTCQLGTVGAPNQCATAFPTTVATSIVALVPEGCKYPTVTVTDTATVTTGDCLPDPNLVNNTATFDTMVVPGDNLPGTPILANFMVNDQKAGSVLFYNFYSSNPTNLSAENTRINITNTGVDDSIVVHLFFVDGSSCTPADAFVCLTPNQTVSFLASDMDPGVSGYIVAVATDAMTGLPIAYNCLIGDEFIKLSSGHAANLGAEAISALTFNPAGGAPGLTATLNFDGLSYNQVPRVLAVDNFPSTADGNNTLLILNRVGGDLSSRASRIGALFGVLYDEAEQPLSFTLSSDTCQLRGQLANNFLRTAQRLETVVGAGRTGWLRLWGVDNIGLLGAVINLNATAGVNNFSQGHNLHKLTLTSASLTIPIIVPAC